MCTKRDLGLGYKAEQIFLELKNMGVFVFGPIVICCLCLPLYFFYCENNPYYAPHLQEFIITKSDYVIPIFSIWWLYFSMREYIEGDGRELLLTGRKSKCINCLIYYALYMVMLIPVMILYQRWIQKPWNMYGKYAIVCFFYCGVAYFLLFSLRSMAVSFLIQLVFTLLCNVNSMLSFETFNYTTIYFQKKLHGGRTLLEYAIIGFLAWLAGYFWNKKGTRY